MLMRIRRINKQIQQGYVKQDSVYAAEKFVIMKMEIEQISLKHFVVIRAHNIIQALEIFIHQYFFLNACPVHAQHTNKHP